MLRSMATDSKIAFGGTTSTLGDPVAQRLPETNAKTASFWPVENFGWRCQGPCTFSGEDDDDKFTRIAQFWPGYTLAPVPCLTYNRIASIEPRARLVPRLTVRFPFPPRAVSILFTAMGNYKT